MGEWKPGHWESTPNGGWRRVNPLAREDSEPDYEQMWEDRMGHGGLDTAGQERMYEKYLDRPWGDA